MDNQRTIVAVKFKWGDALYDYFADFPVEIGQLAYVETKRGEAKVEIVEIKTESDRAEKALLRLVDARTDEQKSQVHPNGAPMWALDGTLLDENGNRSIFDDVDQ